MTTVLPTFQRWAYRGPANLPQTALGALFTVSGGPIWAIVIGRVTTGLGASASLVKLVADPTLGSDSDLSAAAGFSMTGFVAGRWVGRQMISGTALSASPGAAADEPSVQLTTVGSISGMIGEIVAPGSISLNATGNQTGQMEWWCGWIPLISGNGTLVVAA